MAELTDLTPTSGEESSCCGPSGCAPSTGDDVREAVRARYAAAAVATTNPPEAAGCCGDAAVITDVQAEIFGSGLYGGIDVLISARRVASTGTDYEAIPLPAGTVDVVLSNCVINLSTDKPQVLREAARVLKPGGRFAVSDVIADPDMDDATRADMAAYTGCIAGALTEDECRSGLAAAGLDQVEVQVTHRVHEHASSAIIRARVPA
jgi:SAM-dependent methyltransferase